MTYRYDILKPLPPGNDEKAIAQRQKATEHNEPLLGSDTLGIEVTEPELALQCERGLGNIDPQHGENANPDLAAIEAAIEWPLPPGGAKLVTIRIDLDALGAMAVLLMRRDVEDLPHFPEIRARIDMIAKADKFDNGPWPGPRLLPQGADQWRTAFRLNTPLPALNAMIHEQALPLEGKVVRLESWLKSGDWQGRAEHEAKAAHFVDDLRKAVERGEIESELHCGGRLAVVTATHRSALTQIGYRLAPVVLARNPAFVFANGTTGVKYTIAQWSAGHADLGTIVDELDRLENGWGGQPNIKGSPQARASQLTFSDLLPVIERHISATNASRFREDINAGAVMRSVRELKAPSRDEAEGKRRDVRRRWRKGPELAQISLKLKVVTPILGGAAETRQIDEIDIIRVPTIRGHLRFWWRALYGHEYDSPSEMYKAESALFGRAAKEGVKEGRSSVEVRVDVDRSTINQNNSGQIAGGNNVPPNQSYALWPAEQKPQSKHRLSGTQFTLTLTAPKNDLPVLRNCLRAWILFGGYGSRTRRGLGSLKVVGDEEELKKWLPADASFDNINDLFEDIENVFTDKPTRQFPQLGGATLLVGNAGQNPEGSWTKSLNWLKEFRQDVQSGARMAGDGHPGRSNWPEPDKIRHITNQPGHAPRYGRGAVWPRAGFGLPIGGRIVGHNEPGNFAIVWHDRQSERDRLASTLILKPLPLANGQFAPCVLWLNRAWPNGQVTLRGQTVEDTGADFDQHFSTPDNVPAPDFITQAGTDGIRAAFCDWLETVKRLGRLVG